MNRPHLAIAMSGGVDSSVAAALCQRHGYDVSGFTMWHFDDTPPFREDIHKKSINDAKKVCEKLSIPHYTIDLRKEFNDIVINNFISEYLNGQTPNPCALCNPTIKWGHFVRKIHEIIDTPFKIVTGHYAKITTLDNGLQAIYKSADTKKDQTYMLWRLSQEQIQNTIFPLADYDKSQVRQIATNLCLPIAEKKDSQDICFLTGKYSDFLASIVPNDMIKTGDIIFENQKKIGEHNGLQNYTIGQRKCLPPWQKPLYVQSINPNTNTINVTDDPENLLAKTFTISNTNWQESTIPESTKNITVQIRYNSTPKEIENIKQINNNILVTLKTPAGSITPGQSAVFYRAHQLLGGGIIL